MTNQFSDGSGNGVAVESSNATSPESNQLIALFQSMAVERFVLYSNGANIEIVFSPATMTAAIKSGDSAMTLPYKKV